MQRWQMAVVLVVAAAAAERTRGAIASGLYTSAVYENEGAMLSGEKAPKGHCLWKGSEKKEGTVICRGGVQLKCGAKGWYKVGVC